MSNVNLAVIGQGGRGYGLMRMLMEMEDVNIVGVCDVYQDRLDRAVAELVNAGKPAPAASLDYRDILALPSVDAVLVATSWQTHLRVAIDAMKAGKYVASEVGGACSVEECWELVQVSRETGMPCMMLENCCYGREELALLNMVKQNVFGELIHTRCAYAHDLRDEVGMGHINRHYRIDNYMHRNGDVYPTHGAVPMGKMLNINRGNRFVSLTSMSTKARGLGEWIRTNLPEEKYLHNQEFALGDVVTTIIKCAHGETLVMTHDTTLPRPYSRGGLVQGTKGIWMEENYALYLDGISPAHQWEPFAPYLEKYEHPLWKWFQEEGIQGGHGGMDYLVMRAYIESVQAKTDTPIDVYDFATYAALTPISEQSVALGGMPQAIPDFSGGLCLVRPPERKWQYSLTEIWDGE